MYKVVDTRTNKTAALKVYDKRALSPAIQQAVMQEISIHGRLTHPHLGERAPAPLGSSPQPCRGPGECGASA